MDYLMKVILLIKKGFYIYTDKNNVNPKDVFKDKLDLYPDEFHYKTISSSGTFYPSNNSNSKFAYYPQKKDIISGNFSTFLIQNMNGVVCHYGVGLNSEGTGAVEKTILKKNNNNLINVTTCWKCNIAYTVNTDDKIKFKYEQASNFDYQPLLKDYIVIEDSVGGQNTVRLYEHLNNTLSVYSIQSSNQKALIDHDYDYSILDKYQGASIKTQRISEIKFATGKVIFRYKNSEVIKNIIIKDNKNNLIRSISFYTSKYNTQTNLTKLDSIYINVPYSETMIYRFSYKNVNKIPPMITTSIDHWGYYNGPTYKT